ncbi:hypothetical protein Micbo1qcDRAFT_167412, partial [Microdochium bolleyi]
MKSWLPPTPYEACLIFEADNNNSGGPSIEQQSLVEVAAEHVVCRQRVIFTNAEHSQHRSHAAQTNTLLCRWTCTLKFADRVKRAAGTPLETALQQIHQTQATPNFAVCETLRRDTWRGVQSVR